MRWLLNRAAALSCLLLFAAPTLAQSDYPSRSIRFIIPFPTGGSTDIVARVVADALAAQLGQTVVSDNRPGASGTLGTKAVADAAPDGYTILMAVAASFTAAPYLFKSPGYDPVKSFSSIGMIGTSVNVLVVSESVTANSVKELLELARQRPGQLTFASSGISSSSYFAAELMKARTGADILHVPYRGAQAYISDLMAGRVQMTFQVYAGALQSIASGKVRPLAVTSRERWPTMPNVPTMIESGVANYELVPWVGLSAPAGTPRPIIERLNKALQAALADPKVVERLLTLGTRPTPGTPEDMDAFLKSDTRTWGELARITGVKPL
jgi:tripartite-type tricarboxylate transporter receptor subunit TctC